jgi:hypothetical protein
VLVGALLGPRFLHMSEAEQVPPPSAAASAAPAATPTEAPSPHRRLAGKTKAARAVPALPASTPKLQKALKPLLRRGTDMTRAADGFGSAVQFAAVAHASKNTDVPFVILKHRVLDEKKSLATAIHESKPQLNARREADRAWNQARRVVEEL